MGEGESVNIINSNKTTGCEFKEHNISSLSSNPVVLELDTLTFINMGNGDIRISINCPNETKSMFPPDIIVLPNTCSLLSSTIRISRDPKVVTKDTVLKIPIFNTLISLNTYQMPNFTDIAKLKKLEKYNASMNAGVFNNVHDTTQYGLITILIMFFVLAGVYSVHRLLSKHNTPSFRLSRRGTDRQQHTSLTDITSHSKDRSPTPFHPQSPKIREAKRLELFPEEEDPLSN